MTVATADAMPRERGHADRLRWGLCFALILLLHACAAWIALHWQPAIKAAAPPPAAIVIDLAPLPTAPPSSASEIPPGPQQVISEPPPPEPEPAQILPPSPPALAAEVAVPLPKPMPRPLRPRPTIVPRPAKPLPEPAPPAAETSMPPAVPVPEAPAVAAPAPGATAAPPSNAVPTWQGLLLGRLEQFKRYPAIAQLRRQQGMAYLRFRMDRLGKVLSAAIERSSGFDALDAETLALIHRAEPLPPPPAEVRGDSVELVVPIEFFLK